jgi:cytoskeletal protein CcmA (bactofilin family)
MKTLLASLLFICANGAHDNLRGESTNDDLKELVRSLLEKVDILQEEVSKLREHRNLATTGCNFVYENNQCILSQTLVIQPEANDVVALKVNGEAVFADQLQVEGLASFKDDVEMEGVDNKLSLEGDFDITGDLEVCGYATFFADITVKKLKHNPNKEISSHDDPEVTIEGELTVTEDAVFEEDLDVEGDADFSEDVNIDGDVTVDGDCDGC